MSGNLPPGIEESSRTNLKKGDTIGDWEYEGQIDGKAGMNNAVWRNKKTGESTYKEHTPQKITHFDECDKHYWQVVSNDGEIQCTKCSLPRKIVWGVHVVRDGELIDNKTKRVILT